MSEYCCQGEEESRRKCEEGLRRKDDGKTSFVIYYPHTEDVANGGARIYNLRMQSYKICNT
jgi:hypothetical protein